MSNWGLNSAPRYSTRPQDVTTSEYHCRPDASPTPLSSKGSVYPHLTVTDTPTNLLAHFLDNFLVHNWTAHVAKLHEPKQPKPPSKILMERVPLEILHDIFILMDRPSEFLALLLVNKRFRSVITTEYTRNCFYQRWRAGGCKRFDREGYLGGSERAGLKMDPGNEGSGILDSGARMAGSTVGGCLQSSEVESRLKRRADGDSLADGRAAKRLRNGSGASSTGYSKVGPIPSEGEELAKPSVRCSVHTQNTTKGKLCTTDDWRNQLLTAQVNMEGTHKITL
ncbi:hypothetical protein BJ508DRAFT_327129 [Ascobolus immersus RN42]|uniref:F-box domain-containing protein n=1 Tax=Ascobolus immersus RN42 TaxID=1160509 RepID=A0A3N4I7C1_ASCIM|nr:hypothetical protein BJ508DRAFT_327129 [Ascobolus immersus RN42]